MSNRSYLFSCDQLPRTEGFSAAGLSEYGWQIPLVHKLMVAKSPRIVRSAIWDHDIAIIADREGAIERTIAFMEKVGDAKLKNGRTFAAELEEMKEFLERSSPSRYLLLEAGEILDMMDDDLEDTIATTHAEITELDAIAQRLIVGKDNTLLTFLRRDWEEACRPGDWSTVLYFDLSDPTSRRATDTDTEDDDVDSELPRFSARASAGVVQAYARQKQTLDARRDDDAPFLASLSVLRTQRGDELAMATLTADLPTWLPDCDIVGLVQDNPNLDGAEVLGYTDFDTLLAVQGEKAVRVGLSPERWNVHMALTPQELQTLQARRDP